jgi:hypothetical protein
MKQRGAIQLSQPMAGGGRGEIHTMENGKFTFERVPLRSYNAFVFCGPGLVGKSTRVELSPSQTTITLRVDATEIQTGR